MSLRRKSVTGAGGAEQNEEAAEKESENLMLVSMKAHQILSSSKVADRVAEEESLKG